MSGIVGFAGARSGIIGQAEGLITKAIGGEEAILTFGGNTYKRHVFKGNGIFTVQGNTLAGVDIYIIAGGGGGGGDNAAGGGAGGLVQSTGQTLTPGDYTVVVGAGGRYGCAEAGGGFVVQTPQSGGNSSFTGQTTNIETFVVIQTHVSNLSSCIFTNSK